MISRLTPHASRLSVHWTDRIGHALLIFAALALAFFLLAPMAAILGDRVGRMSMSSQMMRTILDSVAIRLDEAREISRYMTGLLIFLGLLGTFWGLIETVGSVGSVINNLKVGGDANATFDSLREGQRVQFQMGSDPRNPGRSRAEHVQLLINE